MQTSGLRRDQRAVRSADPSAGAGDGVPPTRSVWTLLIWVLPAAAVLVSQMPANDLAYQVRAGSLMAHGAGILRSDPFTFTVAGRPWVDQQWAAQLALWILHAPWGWRGLVLARAAIVGIASGLTFTWTRRTNGDERVAAAITFGALLVAMSAPGTLAMRPQLLAVPFFLVATWIVRSRSEHPRRMALLPVLTVGWVNVHGSFVLMLVLVGLALVGDVIARRPDARWTALAALGCVAGTLANPWGAGVYRYLIDLTTSPIVREVIDEWRPIWRQSPAGPLFLAACAGAFALYVRRRRRAPTFEEVAGIVVFTVLAVLSGRNLLWWALYVPPVLGALVVGRQAPQQRRSALDVAIAGLLLAILAVGLVRVAAITRPEDLLSEAPVGITSALVGQLGTDGGRVFDGWWGSWFEFAVPDVPMFSDARVEIYPPEVWSDYFTVSSASPGWNDVLDRWAISTVVASRDHQGPLIDALRADDGWTLDYEDAVGAVFVRSR
jgi:hypothetical protein